MPQRIHVELGGITRCSWNGVVEIPDGEDPAVVLDRIYDHVDGGEFKTDFEFWEKGDCTWEHAKAEDGEPVMLITDDGDIVDLDEEREETDLDSESGSG